MALTEDERNKWVIENTGLVKRIAADIAAEYDTDKMGIPFEDLVAGGMLALVQAARR